MSEQERTLWALFCQLRRHRFPLGPEDYDALRLALRAGFGWSSRAALAQLCCALWAKTKQEREVLLALFNQLDLPTWEIPQQGVSPSQTSNITPISADLSSGTPPPDVTPASSSAEEVLTAQLGRSLPPISVDNELLSKYSFVFLPQFPLTYREVAQAWRRLRQPLRLGPPTELDIEQTVLRRCQSGATSPVVLRPRRRNTARLLLLLDRRGSMEPFHRFTDEVCRAIIQAGKLENVALFYFQNVPAEGAEESVLAPVAEQLFPTLDSVLPQIKPLADGLLYRDSELLSPASLTEVLKEYAAGAAVVIISDAGAARRHYSVGRLLDTVAFIKALRGFTSRYVWLNPLPRSYWTGTTAEQIARHLSMFTLDRQGIYQAVNVLRGQPHPVARPV